MTYDEEDEEYEGEEEGDLNRQPSTCFVCDQEITPRDEHDCDLPASAELFDKYYGSNNDDGDICYECLVKNFPDI